MVKTEWDRETKNMNFIKYWYFQYLLCSALYMLEPWERNMFHGVLFLLLAMVAYTAYIYIPLQSAMLYRFFMDLYNSELTNFFGSNA